MENKKEEQVIYLKDLLFAVLKSWRAILIVALIVALLLGGWKGVSNWQAANNPEAFSQYQAQLEQYENSKASMLTEIEMIRNRLDSHQTYMEESIFMDLDPYAIYQAGIVLYADTGYKINPGATYQNTNKLAGVLAAYAAAFTGDTSVDQLAQAVESQSQYILELLSCNTSVEQGTVTVTVRSGSKEDAQALTAKLAELAASFREDIRTSVSEHTVSILNQSVVQKVDLDVAEKQTKMAEQHISIQDDLTEAEQKLAALPVPAMPSVFKTAVVFAVLGAVLGSFLTVCVVLVGHIASDKVFSAKALSNRTGIKVLGCLPTKVKCFVDRWLNKLEGRCTNEIDSQAQLLAVYVRNRCADSHHLLVTGNANPDSIQLLTQALRKAMPDVQITEAPGLLNNAKAADALPACDTVLLTEQCSISRYSQVTKQIETICDHKKELIGCVLVNG